MQSFQTALSISLYNSCIIFIGVAIFARLNGLLMNHPPFQTASYILMALALLLIVHFHFLPLVFAIILTFIFIEKTNRGMMWLRCKAFNRNTFWRRIMNAHNINLASTLLVIGIVCLAVSLVAFGIYHFIHGNHVPVVIDKLSDILENTRNNKQLPDFLLNLMPSNLEEIKTQGVALLKQYRSSLTTISKNSLAILVYIILGIVIGAMLSFHTLRERKVLRADIPEFKIQLLQRIVRFKNNFEQVFMAQAKISLINTALTALYLFALLPLFGIDLPFRFTVVIIAFIVGLIPVAGNLISNTVIIILSLGVSLYAAIASLIFLAVIHKLEYFLNAEIIGSRIDSSAWELLIVMVVAERLFGISGIVAAPIYYAYVKQELKAKRMI